MIDLEDAETGQRMLVDTASAAVRREIASAFERRRQELVRNLRRSKVDHIPLRTDQDWDRPLIEFFQKRQSRLAHE